MCVYIYIYIYREREICIMFYSISRTTITTNNNYHHRNGMTYHNNHTKRINIIMVGEVRGAQYSMTM